MNFSMCCSMKDISNLNKFHVFISCTVDGDCHLQVPAALSSGIQLSLPLIYKFECGIGLQAMAKICRDSKPDRLVTRAV